MDVKEAAVEYLLEAVPQTYEDDVPPGYKRTEVGVIPKDWVAHSLRNGITLKSGQHVLARYCNTSGVGTPYITGPADFPLGEIQHTKYTTRPGTICRGNDILVTVKGSGAGAIVLSDQPYCISRQLMAIYVDQWHALYVYFSLVHRSNLFGAAATGLIPGLSRNDILSETIALPPTKAEQHAIATALSDADALIAALQRLIAKKRAIKQGTMQALLTGRQRLPGFTGEWEVKRLGELSEIVMGQSPSSAHYNTCGDGLPLIQGNADVRNRQAIKRVFTTQITKRGTKGDILMSVRAPVGEVSRTAFDVCLGRGVCAIRFSNDFLYHILIFLEPMWAKHSKGSTFDSVNSNDVKAVEIKLPPDPDEQTAIATVLADMDAEIEALEARLAKTRQLKAGMMQQLLTGRIRLVCPKEAAHD